MSGIGALFLPTASALFGLGDAALSILFLLAHALLIVRAEHECAMRRRGFSLSEVGLAAILGLMANASALSVFLAL